MACFYQAVAILNSLPQMLPQQKKWLASIGLLLVFTGAGTGGRTPDLLITNQLLYH